MENTKIDILIVSGARPLLLEQTIKSFSENLFKNFDIANVYANIDPFDGGLPEVNDCEAIIHTISDNVVTRKPEESHFTQAVKWLWSSTKSPYCLHIEDDWLLNDPVHPEDIFPHFEAPTTQVSFLSREKVWHGKGRFHYDGTSRSILGIKYNQKIDYNRPLFTTSPCFVERKFANHCAELMDTEWDPEKQLYNGMNEPLSNYTKQFRNYLFGNRKNPIITDLGRDYREKKAIIKKVIDGQSVWINKN